MRVIVTGGAGYIGRGITDALTRSGHEVFVVDDLSRSTREGIKADFFRESVLHRNRLISLFQSIDPDAVINAAGYKDAVESFRRPDKYLETNALGFLNVLDASDRCEAKLVIQSSSCAVYDRLAVVPLTESSPTKPSTPYGLSKLNSEYLGKWWSERTEKRFISLRYFNVAGANLKSGVGERYLTAPSQLFPATIRAIQTGNPIRIHTLSRDAHQPEPPATPVRDYLHIEDVAEAHVYALESDFRGVLNIGSGVGHSVLDVVSELERVSGRSVEKIFCEQRRGDPATSVASGKLASTEIGWRPQKNLFDMCDSAWKWHCLPGNKFN